MPRYNAHSVDRIFSNDVPTYNAVVSSNGSNYFIESDKGDRLYKPTDDWGLAVNGALGNLPAGNVHIATKAGLFEQYTGVVNTRHAVELSGAGENITQIRAQAAIVQISSSDSYKIFRVRDMSLLGNSIGTKALYFNALNSGTGEGYLYVSNVHSYAHTGVNFEVAASAINHFYKVRAYDGTNAIKLTSTAHVWIDCCDLEATTGEGLLCNDTEETWISHTKFDIIEGAASINLSNTDSGFYMSNSHILNSRKHGIATSTNGLGPFMLSNVHIENPSVLTANTYDGISKGSGGQLIAVGCTITDINSKMQYGLNTAGNDGIFIGSITGAQTAPYNLNGGTGWQIINAGGNVELGAGAVATDATNGFLYVPTCAGTPTGAPTAHTGYAPIVVNTTNNKLYFYSGAAWRDAGP